MKPTWMMWWLGARGESGVSRARTASFSGESFWTKMTRLPSGSWTSTRPVVGGFDVFEAFGDEVALHCVDVADSKADGCHVGLAVAELRGHDLDPLMLINREDHLLAVMLLVVAHRRAVEVLGGGDVVGVDAHEGDAGDGWTLLGERGEWMRRAAAAKRAANLMRATVADGICRVKRWNWRVSSAARPSIGSFDIRVLL